MRIIAFSVLLLGSISVLSQDEQTLTTPRALFKVAPQNFALNTLKVGAEVFNKSGTKSYSLYLYGRFDGTNGSEPLYYGEDVYKGVGSEFQYRKYVSPMKSYVTRRNKNYLQGIYVSGYVQAASFKKEGDFTYTTYDWNTGMRNTYSFYVDENTANWGTGFTIGLHRTFWSVLFVDAYLGGGIQWSDTIINYTPSQPNPNAYYSSYSGITSPGYQGIMPKFGVQFGILL